MDDLTLDHLRLRRRHIRTLLLNDHGLLRLRRDGLGCDRGVLRLARGNDRGLALHRCRLRHGSALE